MAWVVIRAKLKVMRDRRGMTIAVVASQAGVSARTIERMESGRQRGIQSQTLEAIAGALGCRNEDIARYEVPPMPDHWPSRSGSTLEYEGAPPSYPRPQEPPQLLSTAAAYRIEHTWFGYDGFRFHGEGRVLREEKLLDEERVALECSDRVGARFEVRIEGAPAARSVTVYTVSAAHTSTLRARLGSPDPVKMIVIVRSLQRLDKKRFAAKRAGRSKRVASHSLAGFSVCGSEKKVGGAMVIESAE